MVGSRKINSVPPFRIETGWIVIPLITIEVDESVEGKFAPITMMSVFELTTEGERLDIVGAPGVKLDVDEQLQLPGIYV
jgi:hypothetical protein